MNKKRLTLLADYLENKVDPSEFDMTSLDKDALYYATRIPELREAGLRYRANDNASGAKGPWYNKSQDGGELLVAEQFFGLNEYEAQYLFAANEYDEYGHAHKSIWPTNKNGGTSREKEPPHYTAARIRAFVAGYGKAERKAG